MSTSSNSSRRTWARPEVVVCNHGLEAEVVTSKTEANPGRRFYRCQIWKHDDCKYFRWIDPSLSPNQECYFQKLKMERDSIEEVLKKTVAKHDELQDKIRSKTEDNEALQRVIDNMCRTNCYLKVAIVVLCVVIFLVM